MHLRMGLSTSICRSVCMSIYLSIYLSVYLSVYLSIYLFVCLSICMFACVRVYSSACMHLLVSWSCIDHFMKLITCRGSLPDNQGDLSVECASFNGINNCLQSSTSGGPKDTQSNWSSFASVSDVCTCVLSFELNQVHCSVCVAHSRSDGCSQTGNSQHSASTCHRLLVLQSHIGMATSDQIAQQCTQYLLWADLYRLNDESVLWQTQHLFARSSSISHSIVCWILSYTHFSERHVSWSGLNATQEQNYGAYQAVFLNLLFHSLPNATQSLHSFSSTCITKHNRADTSTSSQHFSPGLGLSQRGTHSLLAPQRLTEGPK